MRHLPWILAGCGTLSYYPDSFEPGDPAVPSPSDDDDDDDDDDDCEDPCDADGDGEPAADSGGKDCDDEDPDVYPGAPDLCDGIDNDCDEIVDGDRDEDGVDVCDDCDDTDDARYPGAPEPCDGVDSDCDELDCLEWEEDFESGALGAPWSMGGAADWFPYNVSQQGQWSAKSGAILDGQRSSMEVVLDFPSPGSVTFWFSVSSEPTYDFLRFFVDGAERDAWSGELAWQSVNYNLGAGTHTLEWRYTKDGSLFQGQDGALIDTITVEGGGL